MKTEAAISLETKEPAFKRRYIAVGVIGRVVGNQVRKREQTGSSSLTLKTLDKIVSRINKSEPLSPETRASVKEAFDPTRYWHGTGRYQYRDGKVVDILDFVAQHGSLQPQQDALDFTGRMESISLARSRMYSRVYADMHGKGAGEKDRHGSSMFWACIFLGDIGVEIAKEARVWKRSGREDAVEHFKKGGLNDWHQKVGGTYTGTMELLLKGSDIKGNYPILFGVREGAFEPASTSRSAAIHEVRSQQSLSLEQDITHVEVPNIKVEETNALLAKYGHEVPVLAIEDCERYVADTPFSQLVAGNIIA